MTNPFMTRLATLVATAGYVGLVPFAPGTAGSAAGLVVYGLVRWSNSIVVEGSVIMVALVVGIWAAEIVEKQLGKDPRVVVIDEVLGMLVTVAFLNVTPVGAAVGFFVFRALDVVKPFPAGRLEHLHGGPGIMLDDAMAGVYANLTLRVLIAVVPGSLA